MARRVVANPHDEKQRLRAAIAGDATEPRLGALLALTHLLAPDDVAPQIAADVERAFTDPAGFIATRSGFSRVKPEILPWVALVHQLTEAKVIDRVDWRSTREEVEEDITALAKRYQPHVELSLKRSDRATAWDFLKSAGTALHAHQLRLMAIAVDADSYPVFVVPAGDLDELQRLAKQAKYAEISVLGQPG